MFAAPRSSFTTPAAHDAYNNGDLVANDVDAADVTPLKWRTQAGKGKIVAVSVFTDDETVTNANFNLYLYNVAPSPNVGDNGASFAAASVRNQIGVVACDMTSGSTTSSTDKVKRFALTVPIIFQADVVYGLLAAAAAYDRDGAELFEVTLEIEE
jgi:hypothetical protein